MIKKQVWVSAGDDYKSPLSMCPCLLSLLNVNENDIVLYKGFFVHYYQSNVYYSATEGHMHITSQPLSSDIALSSSSPQFKLYRLPVSHSAICKCKTFPNALSNAKPGAISNAKTNVAACAVIRDSKVCCLMKYNNKFLY